MVRAAWAIAFSFCHHVELDNESVDVHPVADLLADASVLSPGGGGGHGRRMHVTCTADGGLSVSQHLICWPGNASSGVQHTHKETGDSPANRVSQRLGDLDVCCVAS
jgi:hypothetical protein